MKIIRGKNAVVTGAASGLGRAIALTLAREGARLFLVDIDETGLADTAHDAQQCGVEAFVHVCDLTDSEQITTCPQAAVQRLGTVHILVNGAGRAYYGSTRRMPWRQWQSLMDLNLMAPIQLTWALLPVLLNEDEAHVLNICSAVGLMAGRKMAAYSTSKFGLVGFSEALWTDYGTGGLGVTALCPGFVDTNLFNAATSHAPDSPMRMPPKWLLLKPQAVADKAVLAIKRNRRLVLCGGTVRLLWTIKRLSPWVFGRLVFVGRPHRKRTVNPADAEPNVAEPVGGR